MTKDNNVSENSAAQITDAEKKEAEWTRWVMQSARTWDDIKDIIHKTGVDSIDNDHRQMTEVVLEINSLADMHDSHTLDLTSIKGQGAIFERLYAYASRHFEREIMIIEKYDLPNLESQKKQHAIFLKDLSRNKEDFDQGRLAVSQDLKAEVLTWWVNHINTLDSNTFSRENWTKAAIKEARSWADVVDIIKYMGIESLDREHKEMTEIALKLIQFANTDSVDKNAIRAIFDQLRECASRHFDHEENFIARYDLPDLEKQKNQHERFFTIIDDSWSKVQAGEGDIIKELQVKILEWWITHINVVDYNAFSMDLWGSRILSNAKSWGEASQFIHHTGKDFVDEDHHKITEHILGIDAMIEESVGLGPELGRTYGGAYFETMLDLCKNHFVREEKLMLAERYANYTLHKEQHDRFLVTLERHRDDFSQGRIVASLKMKHFILDWWVDHIKEFDQRAFGCVGETDSEWKGLSEKAMWNAQEETAE